MKEKEMLDAFREDKDKPKFFRQIEALGDTIEKSPAVGVANIFNQLNFEDWNAILDQEGKEKLQALRDAIVAHPDVKLHVAIRKLSGYEDERLNPNGAIEKIVPQN